MPYLSEQSYLQLVLLPEDEKVTLIVNWASGKATARIKSDLDSVPLPTDGDFEFHIESLDPGEYIIAVQHFCPSSDGGVRLNYKIMTLLREANDQYSEVIEIPENISLPFAINMGEVVIRLP